MRPDKKKGRGRAKWLQSCAASGGRKREGAPRCVCFQGCREKMPCRQARNILTPVLSQAFRCPPLSECVSVFLREYRSALAARQHYWRIFMVKRMAGAFLRAVFVPRLVCCQSFFPFRVTAGSPVSYHQRARRSTSGSPPPSARSRNRRKVCTASLVMGLAVVKP